MTLIKKIDLLETPDGDKWVFDDLEEARRNKYFFGGTITEVDEDKGGE